ACTTPPDGLLAWWAGEGTAADVLGGHPGTVQNGATYDAGIAGQAFFLDGANDYISVPNSADFHNPSLTVNGWFNFANTTGTRILVAKSLGTGSHESFVLYMNGGTLSAAVGDGSGLGPVLTHALNPEPDTWHHIAYAYDQ